METSLEKSDLKWEEEEIKENKELWDAINGLSQPRPDYVLRNFVIGKHETEEMRYAHTVLNLRLKYNTLRRSKITLEKLNYEIQKLKDKDDELSQFELREKEIDKQECEIAVRGGIRELACLYQIWKEFKTKFTREDINKTQPEYWKKRITQQANDDVMSSGRISKGNLQALNQIGMGTVPELDHIREIEKNYLEEGNVKLMIAVATEEKPESLDDLECLKDILHNIPQTIQRKFYNCSGRSTAEAYNNIAMEFLKDGADLLLVVEDDTFPPTDAFIKLYEHIKQGKKAVGAWYPKRQERAEGVPIVMKDGKREFLEADGETHEVYTLPMGCTLYTAEAFLKTTHPYFVKTDCLTQDSFFSQKLREANIKMYIDTSIKCKHIDRETKKVYELIDHADVTGKKVLNVGGGSKSIPLPNIYTGWEHTLLDIANGEGVDIVADAVDMPINGERFDSVYCSHNLEHYNLVDVIKVLNNFRRVLKEKGYVCIRVPDIGELDERIEREGLTDDSFLYESPAGRITVKDVKEGFQKEVLAGNEHYRHKISFTKDLLEFVLVGAGFKDLKIIKDKPLELTAIAYNRETSKVYE